MLRCLALASALVLIGGCISPSDPLGRREALVEVQKKYTDLVRWGEAESAGRYVDPALRDDFVALAHKLADFRVTDFEIGEIEPGEEASHVTVTYRGYALNTLVERSARERQEWYRDEGLGNNWLVRPELGAVIAQLQGAPYESSQK